MNFYIQVIDQNGVPKRLIGPGTYEQCEEKGKEVIAQELKIESDRDPTQDEVDGWEMDGSFSFESGGGIYIVCSEDFS